MFLFKTVPLDAGWRFWNWSRRFSGLIGEDPTGNHGFRIFSLENILQLSAVDIPPKIEEEKKNIRQNNKSEIRITG